MNCLEFRKAVLAEPRRPGSDAAAHAAQCVACAQFLERALQFEDALARALRVDAPRDLSERLLEKRAARWRWMAAAAMLLAAVALAFLLGAPRSDPVALAAIDFVVFDEAQAIAVARPADRQVLAGVSRKMRVSLPEQLGEIHYICVYPFAGGGAHHVLVDTPLGKVTLLLMPEVPLASRTTASARGLSAAIVPAAVGSVAIIGESSRGIARVETLLKSS